MKLLDNYLQLEEVKTTELEVQGLVLAENTNLEKPNIAVVVEKGPTCKPEISVGDKVLFKYHLFDEITLDKKPYLIGKDEGVIGIC